MYCLDKVPFSAVLIRKTRNLAKCLDIDNMTIPVNFVKSGGLVCNSKAVPYFIGQDVAPSYRYFCKITNL